ncbi:hypothetical protein, partial [Staphylococcus epidermidis]|uniref:hypothetical protein n=1 Tax=Staphylococcus epidermidis TaxID=1282 RepID=UPI002739FB8D
EILNTFYKVEAYSFDKEKVFRELDFDLMLGQRADEDFAHPKTGEVLVKKNRKFTKAAIDKLKDSGLKKIEIPIEQLAGKVVSEDHVDPKTGEVLVEANTELTEEIAKKLSKQLKKVKVIFTDPITVGAFIRDTLVA